MNNACYRIGIFDSGLGGLSVVKALQQRLPAASLYYVADSGFAPYGPRPADYVLARSRHIAAFLLQQRIDALVIACNTATAAAAVALRAELSLPVIAMEPGVKPAVAASRNGIIGVLATQGTLASQQFTRLRQRLDNNVKVIDKACHGWVELVEAGREESVEAYRLVANTLQSVLAAGADTLVLGCTHFPFLTRAIRAAAGPNVTLIETADAVALQTRRRLADVSPTHSQAATYHFWSSGDAAAAAPPVARLLGINACVRPLDAPQITAS